MRPSLTHLAIAALLLSALALCPPQANAGTEPTAPGFLTDAQSKQLLLLSERIDARLKDALAGSEKQAELMRRELGQMAALKDPAAVAKAVSVYQARHALFHADLLTRSGISLASVAVEMQRIAPELRFEAKPNGTIVGSLTKPAAAPAPKPPTGTVKTMALSDLASDGSTDCGAISGGANTLTRTSAESRASATVAGRCTSRGHLQHALDAAGARRATLNVAYGTGVDLSTLSVIGSSIASAHLSVSMDRTTLFSSSHMVFAPLLWAASEQVTSSGQVQRTDVPTTGEHQVHLHTQAAATAGVGADARASAKLRDISATLQLEY